MKRQEYELIAHTPAFANHARTCKHRLIHVLYMYLKHARVPQVSIVKQLLEADGVEMTIPMHLAVLGVCADLARDQPVIQVCILLDHRMV